MSERVVCVQTTSTYQLVIAPLGKIYKTKQLDSINSKRNSALDSLIQLRLFL